MTSPTGDAPANPQPGGPVPGHPPPPGHSAGQGYPAAPGYPPAAPQFGPPGYAPWTPPPAGPYGPAPHGPAPYGPAPYGPVQVPGHPPAPTAPDGRRLADFGDRLVACLIDAAVMGAVSAVLIVPGLIAFFLWFTDRMRDEIAAGPGEPPSFGSVVGPWLLVYAGVFLLALVANYLYEVEYACRHNGQSIGKRAMKIRIVPLDPSATYHRGLALKRWLIMDVVGTLLPGFIYVDGLWQLGDKPYRQCLHDKYATTVVVKDPS